MRSSNAARSEGVVFFHGDECSAWWAARTAVSTSWLVPAGTEPQTAPVAGSVTSMRPVPCEAVHPPSKKCVSTWR